MYSPGLSLSRKRFLNLFAVFALLLTALPIGTMRIARAATASELFFSEYIEGSSNNKALEIYNGTGATLNLGTLGYNVQMFFNGNPVATLTINLTGSVADGDVYVLAQSAATSAILAQADQTNGSGWFNGDDAVALRKGTTVLDVIGQTGFDPGTEWGSGLTSTADNTLRRMCGINSGDTNGSDAFNPSAQWDGFATDTFTGLGSHTIACETAPAVSSTDPAGGAINVPLDSNINVTFSEPVTVSGSWFTISCANSGSHAATASGGPTSFTLDPASDFANSENCTVTIAASQVIDQDTSDPPDNMSADYVWSFTTVGNVCDDPFTPIHQIQGSGPSAAITGNVTTEGVVVGDYEGNSGLQGFYLQDVAGDSNVATSDGIFVYMGSANTVSSGDLVRVTGFARERFNQTAINGSNSNGAAVPAANIVACGTASLPVAATVTMPFENATYLERFEGMRVNFSQTLTIAEYFNYARFGELVLAYADGIEELGGQDRLYTPTGIVEPGAEANALAAEYALRRITLDDGLSIQNPSNLRHPNGDPFTLSNRFRGGDTVQNVVGVLGFDFSLYRIQPTGPADFTVVNSRPAEPEEVGGSLRVGAFNTLNYFLTLDATGGPSDNVCGGNANLECRGADADQPQEFERQRTKLLQALIGLDADALGLNELENTPNVEPLADIVAGLNDILGPGTYDYIETGTIGTDAIKVGIIYKPAALTPVGDFAILTSAVDPRFIDTRSRPSLAQTFEQPNGARFTMIVNHLKSKGSACDGDPDLGDGQGNCNGTRTAAAQALVDWAASDPTGSGDADFVILGDLNAYAMEDPVDAIKAGADDTAGTADDWTNLTALYKGTYAYSYVFDGQAGYLDHALGNASLAPQVTGLTEWHINADEPNIFDYDTSFKPPAQDALYEPNAFRTSDHDPVLIGLDLNAPPSVDAGGPYSVDEGDSVTVEATGSDPNGDTLTYEWDLDNNGSFETSGQSATFSAANLDGPSSHTINVRVTDGDGLSDVSSATVSVDNVAPQVGAITAPTSPVPVNSVVNASASFTDPGVADTHTAVWSWGDNTTSPGTIVNGQVSGSHTYTSAGIYTVVLTVTDDDGDSGESTFEYVLVYNPTASVTGGGWVNTAQGKASFSLNASYKNAGTTPSGQVGVNLPGGAGNFKSASLDLLVVSGTSAQLRGSGTINGAGNYQFEVWADDQGSTDTVRIKIWYTDITGEHVVFDNGSASAVEGGNIQVRDR